MWSKARSRSLSAVCQFSCWYLLHASGEAPLPDQKLVSVQDGDGLRQLQGLAEDITSPLPSGLTVTIGDLPDIRYGADIDVVAGMNYSAGIQLELDGQDFAVQLDGIAKLRLVLEGTPAQLGGCSEFDNYWPGGIGFENSAVTMLVDGSIARSMGPISFMLGGHYRICYSHDGTFGGSSELLPVPRNLKVRGAKLNCKADRCLEQYRWRCFVYKGSPPPAGSCALKFDSIEYVQNTSATGLSWGATVRVVLGEVTGWGCGEAPSAKLAPGYQLPVPGSVGREFLLRPLPSSQGFSVQACYCPAYGGCNAVSDYLQPVGRVHFFYSWICDDAACSNEFPAAFPGSPFSLHIDCAGAKACTETAGNRVKVIDSSPLGVNDRPSWAEDTGCRSAVQAGSYWRPHNCVESHVAKCGGPSGLVNGGTSAEVKVFPGLVIGPAFMAGVPVSRTYDVCYCDERCDAASAPDAATRFHKVGRIFVRPYTLLAIRDSGTDTGIRAVGVAGDLMVDGRGNVPLPPLPAQAKILWDNLRVKTSADCAGRRDLVTFPIGEGPTCTSDDDCSYKASTLETNPPENFFGTGEVVSFNDGGTQGERIRFLMAGIVAICYCGMTSSTGACLSEDGFSPWILMARTVIRGPCVLNPETELCGEDSWTFHTGVTFHLTIRGIGLKSTDKIRIISENSDCRDNPDGGGEPTVLKGCPAGCHPLNLADTYAHGGGPGRDDVDLQITTSDTVGCGLGDTSCRTARVLEVLPSGSHTTWRFDADPELADGDIVVLENVTGGEPEENALMAGQFGIEPLGWPVARLANLLLVRVPAHLDHEPRRFLSSGAWYRHSVARTRKELRATAAKSLLQVCWGSGPDAYHARAGRISFVAPTAMASAMVAMSGFEGGRRAPVVVAFRTNSGGESALKYRTAVNSMQLRLSFSDVAKVEPRLADVDGQPMPEVAPSDRNKLRVADQSVCGTLFLEMWSDDSKGFPLARGCYYSDLRQNTRDLHIVFEPKSGLEPGQYYQLVLNARVAVDASTLHSVLSLYSMDDVEVSPFGVVEVGDARLSRNPQVASGIGEPRFMSSGGLTLLDERGELRELLELATDPASLLFRLRGDGQSRITAGSQLRIFLWPLTVWDLRPTCQAQCQPHRTRVCGAIASCSCEAVVSGSGRNVIRLRLPTDMTEIYGATVQHTVRVSELSLPRLGFFGTRFAAQISAPDDSRVHYIESSGAYIWKPPSAQDPQMTIASIVTHEGDGNDRPFRGDLGNSLYVRLALGAALMSELEMGDALFRLTLPPGFSCQAVSPAPTTLGVFGIRQPQGRGSLPASATADTASSWHLGSNMCEYRLRAGELIPPGSRIFFKLTVDQPDIPLQEADVLNRWFVELSSKGWYRWARQRVAPTPFVEGALQDDEYGDFGASVPLLGKLVYDNLQPSSFQAGARDNVLQVFFRPEQPSGYRGMVLVKAPVGFNFATDLPDNCRVSRLPEVYYRTTGGRDLTEYLPIVESCLCDCSAIKCPEDTFNRAGARLKNSLRPEFTYGFRLELINKPDYAPGDEDGWTITTTDATGRRLDASYLTARLNPAVGGAAGAWGVYEHEGDPDSVTLHVSSLRPTLDTGSLSSLTISSVQLPATAVVASRLIAPDGFRLSPADFVLHSSAVPGATAHWPGGLPWQSRQASPRTSSRHGDQAKNVLVWGEATFLHSESYGFIAKVGIPESPVVATSLFFILQFGWDAATLRERPVSFALPVPQVRSITDFAVRYSSNIAGSRQLVTVVLETSAVIPINGMLRLEVPGGFTFDEKCNLEPVPAELPPPELLTCSSVADQDSGNTALSIVPTQAVWPSGRLAFALRVRNPAGLATNRGGQATSCGYEHCWLAQALDAQSVPTEMHSAAHGFAINRRMPEAKLLDLSYAQRVATARNDRPGMANNLIFAFQLVQRPASAGDLILAGPYGYSFNEDCLPGLRLDDGPYPDRNVFGYLSWFLGYARWEVAAEVQSCVSSGPAARLHIEQGLRAARMYAFRIHVAANPVETPSPNLWTLEYAGESCTPFEGFSLWTFTDYMLHPTTVGATDDSSRIANPVVFTFRPQNEVAADPAGEGTGGLLRIVAPPGFAAATEGALGRRCAAYLLREGQTAFLPEAELQCQPGGLDLPNVLSFQLRGSRRLEAGRLYHLTAQFLNPLTATSTTPPWQVTTFSNPSGTLEATLDATNFPGYAVKARPSRWTVTAPAGEQHAGSVAAGVSFQVAFRTELIAGDKLLITAPAGFHLAAPRQCSPQVGAVLGGTQTRVGSSTSLQQCAELVWQEAPAATASSWHTIDFRCFAHFDIQSLELCDAAATPQDAIPDVCAAYTRQVCSFAGTSRACHNFRLEGTELLSSRPVCEENTLLLRLAPGDILPGSSVLAFALDARNPTQNPSLTESLWIVEQYGLDNALEATAATLGWPVIPELVDVGVQLTGRLVASGATSQLSVELTPASDADRVQLTAVAPPGFDFSTATVTGPDRSVIRSAKGSVLVACALSAGQRLDPPLVLDSIQLSNPGPATFSLATFRGALKVDETLSVSGSATFSVPGRIQVTRQRLAAGDMLPVNGTPLDLELGPRANDLCTATFYQTFSTGTSVGDVLVVSAEPFSFPTDNAGSGVEHFKLSFTENGAPVQTLANVDADGMTLKMVLMDPLEAGRPYTLKVLTRSGPLTTNNELWQFEVQRPDRPGLPVNTNDAGVAGFSLVHAVSFSLNVGRVAPGSLADVMLTVAPGMSQPEQLILRVPPGFSFPVGSCIRGDPSLNPLVLGCRRLTRENMVELQLSSQSLSLAVSARIAVRAPAAQDPALDNTWLVQARAQATEVGWGMTSGFSIVEMELVRLVYAGVPASQSNLAVIFSTTQGLIGGGTVEVRAPEAYQMNCPASESLQALGLRGVQLCSDTDNSLRLMMNETLAPGSYAFVLSILNPSLTPSENSFSVALRDHYDNIVDARMDFAGNPVVQGLDILPSQLSFSSSAPFAQAEVQVSLRLRDTIDPYEAMGPIRSLQISVPERFLLITREPVLNLDGLPTPETSWSRLLYAERLVRVDLVRREGDMPDVIPAGTYRLSFQVRLPEFWMPSVNIWILSLCRDLRCTEPIADTAMAGFNFGDAPTLGGGQAGESSQGGNAQPRRLALPCRLLACVAAALAWAPAAAAP